MTVFLTRHHAGGQIFQIHLMHDAGVGGNHAEIAEGFLAPAQEGIALFVAIELHLGVESKRVTCSETVDLHGMINDEIHGHERINPRRIAAQRTFMASRIAARSTIAGTPVKSCISTRAQMKAISLSGGRLLTGMAKEFTMSSALNETPSSCPQQVFLKQCAG